MVAAVSRGPCHSMESILVKILAVVLALSQVSTRPDDVRTQFDAADRAQVVELLRAGCAHMRKVFEVEDLALDDLVETALADPTAIEREIKAFRGINFGDLNATSRELCKNETPTPSPIDIGQVIDFFNKAAADLPDHTRLKGLRLASPSKVIDGKGAYFAELYEPGNRRIPVSLSEIPETVSRAFVAAEQPRNEAAHHFFDYLAREVKTVPGLQPLANATYTVRSTIYPDLQKATEAALQEGLAQYELKTGRVDFQGAEANLSDTIKQLRAERASGPAAPGAPPAAAKPDWLH